MNNLTTNQFDTAGDDKAPLHKRATHLLRLVVAIGLVSMVGCKSVSGPDYKQPELPDKATWSSDAEDRKTAKVAIQREWWKGFGSEGLNQLIASALHDDIDMKILALRIERAGIDIGEQRDQSLQRKVDSTISDNFQKSRGSALTKNLQFGVNAEIRWEIDVWGKAAKGVAAKEAEYHATEADWRAGYLTLVTAVASKYFEVMQFDEQINNQNASLKTQRELLAIYGAQHQEGMVPESRVLSQRAEVSTREKDLLELERQRKAAVLRLATLVGQPAGSLTIKPGTLTAVKVLDVPEGLPSDLLARRPDVIAQEYRVLASHNLLGQARLAKLPSFSLTGSAGLASSVLSGLLKSWTLGLAPSISIPIFDPTLDRRIESQTIDTKIAEENYRKTVYQAFEEVEVALLNLAYRKRQLAALEDQIKNLRVVRDVQYAQLREGLVSQLEVFETDRTLLGAQQGILTIHQQILTDTLTLYKALGGGWSAEVVGQR